MMNLKTPCQMYQASLTPTEHKQWTNTSAKYLGFILSQLSVDDK